MTREDRFVPPASVARAAELGLTYRREYSRGGTRTGLYRAWELSERRGISLNTVKRMHAFFSRHAKNFRPDRTLPDGGPTAGTIAWLLWGGTPGAVWAAMILGKK